MKIDPEFKVNLYCFMFTGILLALFSSIMPSWSWLAFISLSCLTIILSITSYRLYCKREDDHKYHNFFLMMLISICMVLPFLRVMYKSPLLILFLSYFLLIVLYSLHKRNSIFSAYHEENETRKIKLVYLLSFIVILLLVFTLKNPAGTLLIKVVINNNLNPYFNSPYSGFIMFTILYLVGLFLALLSASCFAVGKEPPREKISYPLKKLKAKNKKKSKG